MNGETEGGPEGEAGEGAAGKEDGVGMGGGHGIITVSIDAR